ncbi:hypothetical protein [Thiolapillus sp.]|uniref:hypothetical protein n=1 Tax=Thiolapillus sp. TaxID=2017437 RepID=UPI003AF8FCD5
MALPDSEKRVNIIPLGRARLIVPEVEGWDSWFDDEGVTDVFISQWSSPMIRSGKPLMLNTCWTPTS